jgi:tryptophanyl-tRNA synthetase
MTVQRVLTGITTSGTPHLGNYAGAIRPAIAASRHPGVESFYFLADYHALIKTTDPLRVQRSTLEIAATWLAAGLDTDRVWFYRQSDIPEIPELTWLITCVAGKGLLNRAHAYKAAVDRNTADGVDPDAGVNMGLYMYPVLMAADILMFKAHSVPVGRDQIQHIEMARDIAGSFNHLYGEHFVLPEAAIDASVATLPGLIFSIVTDSKAPGEPKTAEGSALFELYQAFSSAEQTRAMRTAFDEGIAWGDAKQALFEQVEATVAPMRAQYQTLIAEPARIEKHLHEGAAKARAIATPFLAEIRHAVGLRKLTAVAQPAAREKARVALPQFKQYREADGRFHFKLLDAEGRLLLQGEGFASPREAGAGVALLKQGAGFEFDGDTVVANGALLGRLGDGVGEAELRAALAMFAA